MGSVARQVNFRLTPEEEALIGRGKLSYESVPEFCKRAALARAAVNTGVNTGEPHESLLGVLPAGDKPSREDFANSCEARGELFRGLRQPASAHGKAKA